MNPEQKTPVDGAEAVFSPEEMGEYSDLKDLFFEKIFSNGRPDLNLYKKVQVFSDHLLSLYPDATDYLFFHILGNSSVDIGRMKKLDFPGKDSVKNFIENLK